MQALISRAQDLFPYGRADFYLVEDIPYEVRVTIQMDGKTQIDLALVDGDDRTIVLRRVYPFAMSSFEAAVRLGRFILVCFHVHQHGTDENKVAASKRLKQAEFELFPNFYNKTAREAYENEEREREA